MEPSGAYSMQFAVDQQRSEAKEPSGWPTVCSLQLISSEVKQGSRAAGLEYAAATIFGMVVVAGQRRRCTVVWVLGRGLRGTQFAWHCVAAQCGSKVGLLYKAAGKMASAWGFNFNSVRNI